MHVRSRAISGHDVPWALLPLMTQSGHADHPSFWPWPSVLSLVSVGAPVVQTSYFAETLCGMRQDMRSRPHPI
jgi:hypothetical protein